MPLYIELMIKCLASYLTCIIVFRLYFYFSLFKKNSKKINQETVKEWCKKHEGHEKENYVQEMPVRFLSRDEEDNQKTTEGVVAFRALRCVQCDEMLYIDQISTYDIQKEFKNGREK